MKAQEHADEHGSLAGADDYYRLLHLDPDAPQQLIAEAYWFLASRLRAEKLTRRSAERELATLNAAYQMLALAEQRRAYDATVSRVQELRRERASRAQTQRHPPFHLHLFKKRQRLQIDYYELLRIDPSAEAPLIARAYSILRTLHSKEATGESQGNYIEELARARSVLLNRSLRAEYDESRSRASLALEALLAPEAKPEQKTTTVDGQGGQSKTPQQAGGPAGPGWQARAASLALKAIVAAAKGGSRVAVVAARLGYCTLLWTAKTGSKGVAATLRAGRSAAKRLRLPEPAKKPAAPLPDDRLLRTSLGRQRHGEPRSMALATAVSSCTVRRVGRKRLTSARSPSLWGATASATFAWQRNRGRLLPRMPSYGLRESVSSSAPSTRYALQFSAGRE